MPDPNDTLEAQLLRKASSIGAPKVGERYLPTEHQTSWDLIKQYVLGGEVPRSVQAQDPYGAEAWLNHGGPTPGLMMGSTEEVSEPLVKQLYSRLQRAFEHAPETMHPSKALSWAKNRASMEEIQHTKLPEYLGTKQGQVGRDEILAHLKENPVRLKETVLGGSRPEQGHVSDNAGRLVHPEWQPTKYDRPDLKTPGEIPGSYRENLIQLDKSKEPPRALTLEESDNLHLMSAEERDALLDAHTWTPEDQANNFMSGHYPQPNTLVHTRTNERFLSPEAPFNMNDISSDGHTGVGNEWKFSVGGQGYSGFGDTEDVARQDLLNYLGKGFTKKNGPKGTFIEEVQSDWHQQGKEKGYINPEDKIRTTARLNEIKKQVDNIYLERERIAGEQYATEREYNLGAGTNFNMDVQDMYPGSPMENNPLFRRWMDLDRQYSALTEQKEILDREALGLAQAKHYSVPDAPFKEAWPDLALKRELLGVAKDPEKSWLGWTTGDTQNDRYNLRKQISKLHWSPDDNTLVAKNHQGANVIDEMVPPEKLADFIGEELAQKLLAAPSELGNGTGTGPTWEGNWKTLHGLDLETGGEGMKHFYDQLLPARMRKILAPFGGTVEKGQIPTGQILTSGWGLKNERGEMPFTGSRQDMERISQAFPGQYKIEYITDHPETFQAWIAKLTPEMKQRIAKEGLPLLTSLYLVYQHETGQMPDHNQ